MTDVTAIDSRSPEFPAWLESLQEGDIIGVRKPWQDRDFSGGELHAARIARRSTLVDGKSKRIHVSFYGGNTVTLTEPYCSTGYETLVRLSTAQQAEVVAQLDAYDGPEAEKPFPFLLTDSVSRRPPKVDYSALEEQVDAIRHDLDILKTLPELPQPAQQNLIKQLAAVSEELSGYVDRQQS